MSNPVYLTSTCICAEPGLRSMAQTASDAGPRDRRLPASQDSVSPGTPTAVTTGQVPGGHAYTRTCYQDLAGTALAGDPGSLELLPVRGRDLDRLVLVDDQSALDLAVVDRRDDLGGINLLVRAPGIGIVEHEKQQQHRYGD